MKKKVVKGCVYSVTAKEDTTITDSAGLNLTVKAGTQETFTAASSEVDLSKDAELVLIKGNFSPASTGTSGGGGGSDSPRAEKLAEYLYEMHVDAIDYDFAEKYFQDHDYPAESGACSAVKAGNIFGRNFDWTYNRDDTYVVRIRPTATRSASISVAARVTKDTDSRIIPFLAKDGINEAGLCVSINVVPHGDKGDNSTVVTAGSEKTLCTVMVPRYILDHFTTAAAAAQTMQTFSYYHPASTIASGYEHHFLIADKDNAYILEFVEGAVVVTEVNGAPFMTNFHVDGTTLNADNSVYTPATQTETETAFSYNHITKHGAGLERWNLLAAGVAGATDVEGMRALMTSLKYTNTYRPETTPRWDTELVGIAELEVDSPTADFTPVHTAVQEQFSKRTRDDAPELQTWQTVHSSVYDMKALSLQLVVQEDASAKYSFALYKGGGEEIELDQIPTQGHVKQAVSSDGVYNSLQAKATLGSPNTFTSTNEFSEHTTFAGVVTFNTAASFAGTPSMQAGIDLPVVMDDTRGYCTLVNYQGDLYWGDTKLNGGEPFDGHLEANLKIGNASYGEHAEWLLYLGDPRHQGELHEETTGIICSKGPDVHHTVDDILEALNVQSQFKDIIVATKVSDYVVKLTAKEAGEGPNSYRFSGEDGSDPEHPVDNPCFGLGGVGIVQTVIGSSATVSATTYTAERNGDAMLALPDVDQEVRMCSPWPVSSGAVARKVDALETDIRAKQDKLTAGTNITIEDNVISATGGGGSFDGNLDADLHVGLQPKTKATGSVQIADAQAAGVLKIGDNPEISIPKWDGVKAYVDLTPYEAYYRSDWPTVGYFQMMYPYPPSGGMIAFLWHKPTSDGEVRTPQDLVDAINGDNDQGQWSSSGAPATFSAKLLPNGKIRLTSNRSGSTGNANIMLAKNLFSEGLISALAGGSSDPRPVTDVVTQLNAAASAYIDTAKTTYDEVTGTVSLEALQAGPNDTISVVSGDLFANPQGMSGGSAGKKIYLNEQLLDIGGPPNAVMPETTLPADNKLQNGHIYLVTANNAEGTDLSALEVVPFAKADIWLEYVAGPVSWSPNWSWVDDMVPEGLAAGTRYFIEVFSDGVAEIAKLKYSYTHA